MRFTAVALLLSCAVLSACSSKKWFGWPDDHWRDQDFKPYIAAQIPAQPYAHPVESWEYPQGTPTQEIIRRWKAAGLVKTVYGGGRHRFWQTPRNVSAVVVGPQFYNLSASSQKGFAKQVAQVYGIGQEGRASTYILVDGITGREVGMYNNGLQLY